ncbi:hypothetical protein BCV70DRAFT_164621 [Testicularia cyperi]|uniref:F-box domain-containing protein n=1 Tax=Testicularia cyperi TaxID=1882483 RepID=A0A317XL65_9BASI|nr:hypothetical protein BCV70DRAFT_164621 [Testicularia cyperi]
MDPSAAAGSAARGLSLQSLPLDLLVPILSQLRHRVRDLAACALTCRLFHTLATPLLYERLFLRDQRRLQLVFWTLARNPELCSLVKIAELRVFPFGLHAELLESLEANIEATFRAANHLEELVWTRTGSLNDRLLPCLLRSSPLLQRLEITGDARSWSTTVLVDNVTSTVQHLSIILPERSVVNAIVDIAAKIAQTGVRLHNDSGVDNVADLTGDSSHAPPGLRSLSLLCQHSPLLKDAHLLAMAPHLHQLQRLSLAGCRAVTGRGIRAVLQSAAQGAGVNELAMEGLDMQGKDVALLIPFASRLRLLSLTYPRSSSSSGSRSLSSSAIGDFYRNFSSLVEHADRLEELTHYAGAGSKPAADGDGGAHDGIVDLDELDDALDEDESEYDEDGEYQQGSATLQNDSTFMNTTSEELIRRFSGPPPEGSVRYGHHRPSEPPSNLPLLPTSFLTRLLAARGDQLIKLRLHGIGISLDQLALVVQHGRVLRDLVIQIWEDDLSRLAALLCQLPQLETLHILASASSDTVLGEREIQWIAQVCADANRERRLQIDRWYARASRQPEETLPKHLAGGNGLRQIGFRNRVWLVERSFAPAAAVQSDTHEVPRASNGTKAETGLVRPEEEGRTLVTLRRWDPAAGTFPEVLLVVKS